MPNKLPKCSRCGGWCYKEDPSKANSDVWCLLCGSWEAPPGFIPLPFVAFNDDVYSSNDWRIDRHGDIVDIIDDKIEALIEPHKVMTVSVVAKKVQCSNSEARMTLERLVKNGTLRRFTYGPQDRWTAYIPVEDEECPTLMNKNPTTTLMGSSTHV